MQSLVCITKLVNPPWGAILHSSKGTKSSCPRGPLGAKPNANYSWSRGISSNSRREHKYSPNKTSKIVPRIWIAYHSHTCGTPPYRVHSIQCMTKRVTPKSRHFLDFSTTIAIIMEPMPIWTRRNANISHHALQVQILRYSSENIRLRLIEVPNSKWLICIIKPNDR